MARRRGIGIRLIHDGFSDAEDVCPREVGRAHDDALLGGGDVRRLVDVGGAGTAEEGEDPSRTALVTGYESFGAELLGDTNQ